MKTLNCRISIGKWEFDFVHSVEIVSSWDTLTDTCTITLPRNIKYTRNNQELTNIFEGPDAVFFRGDKVKVELGYDGEFTVLFGGYVADVRNDKPTEILCEDPMYQLKQSWIDKLNLPAGKLSTLINTLLGDGSFENERGFLFGDDPEFEVADNSRVISDIDISEWAVANTTIAKVLDKLRKNSGIATYFRPELDGEGNLFYRFVCGLPYSTEDGYRTKRDTLSDGGIQFQEDPLQSGLNQGFQTNFEFGKNIISDSDLIYKSRENIRVLVIGNSRQKDNTVLTYQAGTTGGDVVEFNIPNLTQESLEQMVQSRLDNTLYEGFAGTMKAFLEPTVRHGETVKMKNVYNADNNGVFLIKKVVTTFGVNGARQMITLDNKIEDVT